ncbi:MULTISPECIES: LysR family transcriptional regulator [Streptomyces]|uniref:LysR family transcriptional regulator n=1 Tax=Streptomyces katrae TaxID=68223 RepID=A0ABT7GKP4_9ACTN|nr:MULTISPECIES: LysR family transcriptional regulator [Streptomyces]MDK9494162.1 LysR family transcriptional regulator [Streptomyces katrae]GLX17223.1 LysR family transcriptional regulator [Streptomyces lavendulae subsp. lavendulae]GLX24918.1 LysR family transcriptional regulator [Streptomyces lavendulae subsp. lavendulae]
MELRDIEIFLTLSEELHFGRTAERLHVSAARVSQAIKKQERSIGAELFERTSRQVRLTPVGEQLLGDLRPVFRSLKESVDRARLTAQGKADVLRIGLMVTNGHELRPFWDAFRARHPQWGLRLSHNGYMDPFAPLRRGEIDLLLSWLPVEEPDLTVGPVLFDEPRVALVANDHRLAGRSSLTLEALADHGIVGPDGPQPDYFEDAFVPFTAPSGRTIERKFLVTTLDELYTLVADGEIIHLLGNQVTRFYVRPDVTYIPVRDTPLLRWGLVWRSDNDSPMVRAFTDIAHELGTMSL